MRLLLLTFALLPVAVRAGVWTRVDERTVRFEGDILAGEEERFAAAFTEDIRELVVDSPGGMTRPAIQIGLAVAARDVKVTVVGLCLSSCANYLFTAGSRRELRGGIVGFHGNLKACFDNDEARRRQLEDLERLGASPEEIRRVEMDFADELAGETELLRRTGVSQELFDRSCTNDKGKGDGRTYAFLLPKPETFERYGFRGVEGRHEPSLIRPSYLLD